MICSENDNRVFGFGKALNEFAATPSLRGRTNRGILVPASLSFLQ
jgi:hypothetical protein